MPPQLLIAAALLIVATKGQCLIYIYIHISMYKNLPYLLPCGLCKVFYPSISNPRVCKDTTTSVHVHIVHGIFWIKYWAELFSRVLLMMFRQSAEFSCLWMDSILIIFLRQRTYYRWMEFAKEKNIIFTLRVKYLAWNGGYRHFGS